MSGIKFNPEGCMALLNNISKIRKDYDAYSIFNTAVDIADYISDIPYDRVIHSLRNGDDDGSLLANQLLFGLYHYFTYAGFYSPMSITKPEFAFYRNVFEKFYLKLSDRKFNPYGMSTDGKYRIYREIVIELRQEMDYQEARQGIDKEHPINYVELLAECTGLLNQGNSMLHNSSKAYKEIENMTEQMKNIVKRGSSIKDKNLNEHFTKALMTALYEKTVQYVNDRADMEISTPTDSYKGIRLANMRSISTKLRLCIDAKKDSLKYSPLSITEEDHYIAALQQNFNAVSFSRYIYSEIVNFYKKNMFTGTPLTQGDNNASYVTTGMYNTFKNTPIPYSRFSIIHNKVIEIFTEEYKPVFEAMAPDALKKEYLKLKKMSECYSLSSDDILRNYSNVSDDGITGDHYVDAALIELRFAYISEKLTENHIKYEPKSKYGKYPSGSEKYDFSKEAVYTSDHSGYKLNPPLKMSEISRLLKTKPANGAGNSDSNEN